MPPLARTRWFRSVSRAPAPTEPATPSLAARGSPSRPARLPLSSPLPVSVRPATASDLPALSDLLAALGYPAPADEVGRRLERLNSDSSAVALVADCSGEILGLVTAHRFTALHAPAQVALLTALVVAESARGRGVGRQLVRAIEAFAREAGCSRIVVTTAEHRAGAHAFYRQLGWEHTGRRFVKALARVPEGA